MSHQGVGIPEELGSILCRTAAHSRLGPVIDGAIETGISPPLAVG